jgi:hypothetical protein
MPGMRYFSRLGKWDNLFTVGQIGKGPSLQGYQAWGEGTNNWWGGLWVGVGVKQEWGAGFPGKIPPHPPPHLLGREN